MAVNFGVSDEQKTTLQPRYDGDGSIWRQAVAHGALTAKTPYVLSYDQEGHVTKAVADNATYYRVIVPEAAVASSATFWGQTGGYIQSMVTASLDIDSGDGLGMSDSVTADLGAYTEEGNAFFVASTDAGGSATTVMSGMLLDREILSVT